MSTPAGQQQSSTATYSQATQALEGANTEMSTIQGQVEQAKAVLQTNYQGPDGHAYAQVMDTWLAEVDRIKHTCNAMEHQLQNSMQSSNTTQATNEQAVANQGKMTVFGSAAESGAYSAMTG
ncbi:hypothetical protein [Streptomyces sp. NPDC048473]|uniref:hypothetical protein n=1 Tax=unclassified Streptomyces TaxID=2593676 RepID=UPI00371E2E33